MSLFVTCVALNFVEISYSSSSSSPLHVSSSWDIPSSGHGCRVHLFASGNASSCSSCRCIHCVRVGQHLSRYPPSWMGSGYAAAVCLQSCLHMDIVLLMVDSRLLPLFVGGWSIKLQDLLV